MKKLILFVLFAVAMAADTPSPKCFPCDDPPAQSR